MTVGSGDVYQSALCNNINPLSVRKLVAHDIVSGLFLFHSGLFQSLHVNLAVEVSRIGENCTVLHGEHVVNCDCPCTARSRYENVA